MEAIKTKYFGPTGRRGAFIKASCTSGSVTIPYPHELSGIAVHEKAAYALVAKLGWSNQGILIGGTIDYGYMFVFSKEKTVKIALGNLCQHVIGNRGSRTGNPYSVPELLGALKALNYADTGILTDEYQEICDAANKYRIK